MYCANCGKPHNENDLFCGHCGAAITERKRIKTEVLDKIVRGEGLHVSYLRTVLLIMVLCNLLQINMILLYRTDMAQAFVTLTKMIIEGNVRNGLYLIPEILLENTVGMGMQGLGAVIVLEVIKGMILFLSMWRIFEKAGIKGWCILIPIYNIYCLLRIAFGSGLAFLVYIILFIAEVYIVQYSPILSILMEWGSIFVFYYMLSRKFEHGLGYAIGLFCFPALFVLILGWGKDEHENLNLLMRKELYEVQ